MKISKIFFIALACSFLINNLFAIFPIIILDDVKLSYDLISDEATSKANILLSNGRKFAMESMRYGAYVFAKQEEDFLTISTINKQFWGMVYKLGFSSAFYRDCLSGYPETNFIIVRDFGSDYIRIKSSYLDDKFLASDPESYKVYFKQDDSEDPCQKWVLVGAQGVGEQIFIYFKNLATNGYLTVEEKTDSSEIFKPIRTGDVGVGPYIGTWKDSLFKIKLLS